MDEGAKVVIDNNFMSNVVWDDHIVKKLLSI
jgi:hypothetical protein